MGVVDNMLHMESSRMVSLSNGSSSEVRLGKLAENGHCASNVGPPKYKRRVISAIRDFPLGCGRFASRMISIAKKEAVCVDSNGTTVGREKRNDVPVVDEACPYGRAVESEPQSVLQSLIPSEMIKHTNHVGSKEKEQEALFDQVRRQELTSANPVQIPLPDIELVKASQCEAVNVLKDSNQLDVAAPKEGIAPTDMRSQLAPSCTLDVPNGNGMEKTMARNYPPRRIISAVRDFPPFCGRNATRLVKNGVDWENSFIEDNSLEKIVATDMQSVEDYVVNGDAHMFKVKFSDINANGGRVQAEVQGHFVKKMRKEEKFVMKVDDGTREKSINKGTWDIRCLKENLGEDSMGNMECESLDRSKEDFGELGIVSGKGVVQGLMASPNCPWRQQRAGSQTSLAGSGSESKGRKHDSTLPEQPGSSVKKIKIERPKTAVKEKRHETEHSGGTCIKKNSSRKHEGSGQLVLWRKEDSVEHDRRSKNQNALSPGKLHEGTSQLVPRGNDDTNDDDENWRSHSLHVDLPPSCPSSSGFEGGYNDARVTRNKVKETLRLFQFVCRKLLQEEEAKSNDRRARLDLQAAKILKEKNKYVNTGKQIIGSVPGVEVGDEFLYRVELAIVGLHRQLQGGIDYVKQGGKLLATSIVASGGYDDDLENSDVLIYTGQGGNVMSGDKQPEDQKLERGNLALANSKDAQNPVRVIRGETKTSNSSDARGKTYIYDGLYLVDKYWQDLGPHGRLVFKFRLVRVPGQPELAWKVVSKSSKLKSREGICTDDISQRRESIPIGAVNAIDNEKPPSFEYTKSMIYPDWCRPIPPRGCDCTTGCSESRKCSCVMKNEGEIPYNHNGAIVQVKPLVYECGPNCKCPPSCYNRVSQHGIRFQLEIFKTESRGWGVRSLNSIPSGSFICEYAGELLEDKEAERRTGNDEYLFDIGNNYNDGSFQSEISTVMPDALSSSHEVVDCGFTIDAAKYGNVGRFINHSCSPNLYAQNVLYDHEDNRLPHIMFFAADNIPPLQELTYDYNYAMDQVRDSNGNVKTKTCYCGSSECIGRMY